MEDLKNHLLRLLNKSEYTNEEKQWLLEYLENTKSNELKDLMQQQFDANTNENGQPDQVASIKMLDSIHEKIGVKKEVNKTSVYRMKFFRIAAAASIIGIICVGVYLLNQDTKKEVAQTDKINRSSKNDVLPGSNKALLTLADGSTIVLDDKRNGTLAKQGNTKVLKSSGTVTYEQAKAAPDEILYNTITTPRGGQYQIVLADGSKVWLNAASSLRFPTAFTGKERRVEITGEAYFEITRNEAAPFIVSNSGAEVQVLGTHFNVMAYSDEPVLKVTLLEGSVKFIKDDISTILKPRQQSQLTKSGQINVLNDVDVGEVMAWKNGFFYFNNADMETVMRQVSRWYNVDVIYQNKKTNDLFHADIPRDTKLSEVLKVLEIAGDVRFKIEDQKVIVSY